MDLGPRCAHNTNCGNQQNCGFNVYVKDGQVLREEQAAQYPRTNDRVPDFNPRGCQKGCSYSKLMYSDPRVTHPLRRVGERGSGRWEKVSWDEALTEIADQIVTTIQEVGPYGIIIDAGSNLFANSSWLSLLGFADMLDAPVLDSGAEVGDEQQGVFLTYGSAVSILQIRGSRRQTMTDYVELPLSGLEGPLTEIEQMVQEAAHRFAADVLRPAAVKIDKLSAEEAIAPESPFWQVMEQVKGLGLGTSSLAAMEPKERARIQLLATEELAWGDVGLAAASMMGQLAGMAAILSDNEEMIEYCEGKMGCWAFTEPDHGSDMLDPEGKLRPAEGDYGRPNCVARIENDKIVINGQKSAWVSGAMTAEVCALYCLLEEDGQIHPGIAVIVPLDAKGVSRGKPLEKLGGRCIDEGELFFDNVEVPLKNLLAGSDTYNDLVHDTLTEANVGMGNLSIGICRAAYEHALAYAHERKQGGVPIIQHQVIRYRLFHMFRKLEAARALVHRAAEFNATAPKAALHGSIAAKITATQTAFEVASEALQIFGGNGLARDYPIEKLLRDARASMISDGCNEMLALIGGGMLVNPDL